MKKNLLIVAVILLGVVLLVLLFNWGKIKLLYTSLNAFPPEHLPHSLQHMAEIQPTNRIALEGSPFHFQRDEAPLPQSFSFQGTEYAVDSYLDKTQTSGLLVIQNDTILHESYRMGSDAAPCFRPTPWENPLCPALISTKIPKF